jgi:hypothetical protein
LNNKHSSNNKNEDENDKNLDKNIIGNEVISLSPKKNLSNNVNVNKLKKVIEESSEKDIKNIAVSGIYGSGKSSIIKSTEELLKNKKDFKFTYISLLNSEDLQKEKKSEDLQKNILTQLLYKAENNKLPFSRFNKIPLKKKYKLFFHSIMILLTLIFIIDMFFKKSFNIFDFQNILDIKLFYNFNNFIINKLIFYLNNLIFNFIISIIFLYFIYLIYKILFYFCKIKNKGFKINIKDIELDNSNTSIFNKYMDEILYFFQETDNNIIVFEDLDRFNNLDIYYELNNLNKIINNNPDIKNNIIFIYALNDSLFNSNDDRIKFFDYILTIPPILNYENSKNFLMTKLENHLSSEYIIDISPFITNMRLLKNIQNEFFQYKDNFFENIEKNNEINEKIFSLILYKNINIDDFEKIFFNESILDSFFKNYNENINIEKNILTFNSKNKGNEIIGITEFLLANSYIEKDYKIYILKLTEEMSQKEKIFFLNVISKNDNDIKLNPKSWNLLYNTISTFYYKNKSILNIHFFHFIINKMNGNNVKDKNLKIKYDEIINQFKNLDEDKINFINLYFNEYELEFEDINKLKYTFILELLLKSNNFISKYNNSNKENTDNIIKRIFNLNFDANKEKISNYYKIFIQNIENSIQYLLENSILIEEAKHSVFEYLFNIDSVKKIFKVLDFNLLKYKKTKNITNIIDIIIKNNYYELNLDNLNFFYNFYITQNNFDNELIKDYYNIFSDDLTLNIEIIKNIENNINIFLNLYDNLNIFKKDSLIKFLESGNLNTYNSNRIKNHINKSNKLSKEECLKYIKSTNISLKDKLDIINNYSFKINNIEDFSNEPEIFNALYISNNYSLTSNNIKTIVDNYAYMISSEDLDNEVLNNHDELINILIEGKNLENLINYLKLNN